MANVIAPRKHPSNLERNYRFLNLHLCRKTDFVDNELPRIRRCDAVPERLVSYRDMKHSQDAEAWIHFYADDVYFEQVWTCPELFLKQAAHFAGSFTPDYSVYWDAPVPMQRWNLYRSRVIGKILQDNGMNVIPTVPFSTFDFNHYALTGLEMHSPVVISTVGCVADRDRRLCVQAGLDVLIGNLQPDWILVYGNPKPFNFYQTKIISYENFKIPAKECAQ